MRSAPAAGFRHIIAALCLAATLSGCTGWHELASITPAPSPAPPQSLRVTLRDGHRVELRQASIVGDSVIGESGLRSSPERRAFAVADIRKVADRQVSAGNTMGAFFGIFGAAALIGIIAIGSSIHTGIGCFCGS